MKQFIFFSLLILSCFVNAQDLNDIKSKARTGDALAQYQLACEYLYDEENPTNYIEVLRLLRESSEKGNKDAADLIIDLSAPGYNGWGDYFVEPFYDHGILSDDFINSSIGIKYQNKVYSGKDIRLITKHDKTLYFSVPGFLLNTKEFTLMVTTRSIRYNILVKGE